MIDADALNEAIERDFEGVSVYDVSPSEAVSDFQSIVDRQPTIQPEPTDEQVAEYCKRRCLHIVTDDIFHIAQLKRKYIKDDINADVYTTRVQPEPHEGEWIVHRYKLGTSRYECGTCHTRCDVIYPYCPYCGEKKGGERNAID